MPVHIISHQPRPVIAQHHPIHIHHRHQHPCYLPNTTPLQQFTQHSLHHPRAHRFTCMLPCKHHCHLFTTPRLVQHICVDWITHNRPAYDYFTEFTRKTAKYLQVSLVSIRRLTAKLNLIIVLELMPKLKHIKFAVPFLFVLPKPTFPLNLLIKFGSFPLRPAIRSQPLPIQHIPLTKITYPDTNPDLLPALDPKIKPLEMTSCVCIRLHVKIKSFII